MASITDLVDALHSGDPHKVTAASLSRVWEHTKDLHEKSFAMLTSWRSGLRSEVNWERLRELQAFLRQKGYGYIRLVGHWRECQNDKVAYKDCPPESLVDVVEYSLLVPGLDLHTAQKLGRRYQQDMIVYGGPEADGQIITVDRDGRKSVIGKKFTTQNFERGFSSLVRSERPRDPNVTIAPDKVVPADKDEREDERKALKRDVRYFEDEVAHYTDLVRQKGSETNKRRLMQAKAKLAQAQTELTQLDKPAGWRRSRGHFAFASVGTDSPMEAQAALLYEKATYGEKLYNCLTGGRLKAKAQPSEAF